MMAMHSAVLPAQELATLRTELAPQYGARVVDEGDRKILLIRVPRKEPDPVNDVESAVDYLDPRDVQDITHCLLLGDQSVAQVYAGPLRDLMADRRVFDKQQVTEWRERLPGALTHQLYRSPADPRRRWRLAVRIPCASVKELEETHLEELADVIGSQLEGARFRELAAVYLIASQDDVRMEPDHFVQELVKTWKDEERRRRVEDERRSREEADRRRQETERRALLRDLDSRFKEKIARAPMRSRPETPMRRAASPAADLPMQTPRRVARAEEVLERLGDSDAPTGAPLLAMDADVDVRPRPEGALGLDAIGEELDRHDATVDRLQRKVDGLTRRAHEVRPGESVTKALTRKLNLLGFDVIETPDTPYAIDLAAERADAAPHRIVFHVTARIDAAAADELLRMARELKVDHVFGVADHIDDGAKQRLVASKVTWFRPRDLGSLRL